MNIARILYPVEVLGPGKRVGIWLRGCTHHCIGCSNPELWETDPGAEITVDSAFELIQNALINKPVDGFVVTGGDPFFQSTELAKFLPLLKKISDDILVYTGYTYEELMAIGSDDINSCLQNISVLIDGRYIEDLNNGAILRGSSNQKIIVLQESKKTKYNTYFEQTSQNYIQNFPVSDGVISVGIHGPDFSREIKEMAKKRGVILDG